MNGKPCVCRADPAMLIKPIDYLRTNHILEKIGRSYPAKVSCQ
jgi:hypothetical protein